MPSPIAAYKGNDPYVFVSYSHADQKEVYAEIRLLQDQGINVWYDTSGIGAGTEWNDEIARAIKNAACFLFFVTPRSVASEHCRRELNFAQSEDSRIIVVHLESTKLPDGLRLSLENRQAIDKARLAASDYRNLLLQACAGLAPTADAETPDERSPPGTRSRKFIVVALALIILLGGALWYLQHAPDADSVAAANAEGSPTIAVMPFTNLSNDPDQVFFSDGIAVDLINELSRSTECVVRPISSSFALRDMPMDAQEAGRRLNVSHLLEGTVRRVGERVRLSVQLIDVAGNQPIWSESYDRDLSDIFEVQDEIAGAVFNAVNARFGGAPTREFVSSAAYTAFLRGRHYFQQGDLDAAEEWLTTAVELDPDNADAWYDLAGIQAHRYAGGRVPRNARLPYLEKALAIDPQHPSALGDKALFETYYAERDYQGAINEFVDLVRTHPNNESLLIGMSYVLLAIGRQDLVYQTTSRALALSPLSALALNAWITPRVLFGDLQEAKSALAKYSQAGGNNPWYATQVAAAEGDPEKLLAIPVPAGSLMEGVPQLLAMYLRGEFDAVREAVQPAKRPSGYQAFYSKWVISLLERDLDNAFKHYRAGILAGEPIPIYETHGMIGFRNVFSEFYADQRYQEMLEEFGLDSESTSKIVVPELPF